MPKRIQLKRTKGWRMPLGAVKVDRSTKFGNPFKIGSITSLGAFIEDAETSVQQFKIWLGTTTAGAVHTNGMENFWSLLKRSIKGTYVHIAPFHLQRYVDEQAFRFNNRKTKDGNRFDQVMRTTVGRRITYRQLCEIDGCGFMGLE